MKKYLILMSAAIMALSCAKDLVDPQEAAGNTEYRTVTFESVMTKTTVDSDGNVAWEKGDKITLYYIVGGTVKTATATADEAGSSATFTAQIPVGDEPTEYYAAYPAGSGKLTTEGTFSINVDASQCDGTFKKANFAAAYSTAEAMSFQFKNAVGMLKVKLPEGGIITRTKDGSKYPVTGVYVRGYKAGEGLNGSIAVNVTGGAVSGFGTSAGPANVNMPTLSSEAIASGYVYVPCTPATLTGLCIMFYSSEGNVPAVLSPEDLTVALKRGHITPLADLSSKIVFDYWVSAGGTGDGLTSSTPMSVEKMVEMMPASTSLQAEVYHLRGATFNFTEGTHSIEKTITIPAYTGTLGYVAQIDGNGNAVLEGENVKVFDVKGNATISNMTIQGTDVSTLSGAAANGAAVTVNAKTKVTLENVTVQNCKAKSGGAVFVAYSGASDADTCLDCIGCKFSENTSTGNGGAVGVSSTTEGGVIRFNECVFYQNKNSAIATVYLQKPILAMFNKCSFYESSKGTSGGRDIDTQKESKLALNNCTLRNSNGGVDKGGLLITRGNTIVANTTFFGTNIGYRNLVGLGSSNENGSLIVNSVLFSQNTAKTDIVTALCLNSGFYQNIKYSLYTSYKWENTKDDSKLTITDSYNMDDWDKVMKNRGTTNGAGDPPAYYALTWDWNEAYPCPTLKQVRDAISSNPIGETFLDWLDTIEGSLSTDIAGRERPANAMCPGSYQQDGVVAKNN